MGWTKSAWQKAIEEKIDRIEGKIDRRDATLFGSDGTGGLVAMVNDMTLKWKLVGGATLFFVLPVLVGLFMYVLTRHA